MTVKKMYLLPAGSCYLDQSLVNQNLASGKLLEMPVWSFLIETSDGPLLIDTGMPDSFVDNPDYYKGTRREGRCVPNMQEKDRIVNILKRVGYQPDDIQTVISSHLHLDHAGGNGHFRNTPIMIQRAEYDAVMKNADYAPPECRIPDLKYQIIEGDHEVAPGIKILFTPGHSPGHQSVLLTTPQSGPIFLTIDAAYNKNIFEHNIPFLAFDSAQASKSNQHLHEIVQEVQPSIIFFGHDKSQTENLRTFPEFF